jgi:hypothetical protein
MLSTVLAPAVRPQLGQGFVDASVDCDEPPKRRPRYQRLR